MRKLLAFVPALAIAVLMAIVLASCDNGDGGTTNASFYITPSSASITDPTTSVVLAAVGGHEPLVWSLSDASLGALTGSGQTVTYIRTASKYGVNVVTVTDSMSWTATATISQPEAGATNVLPGISPTAATLDSDGAQVVFTASGGVDPYTWGVGDSTRGGIVSYASSQALYTRTSSGDNTAVLYDANGHMAVATITQPATAALAISPLVAAVTGIGGTQAFTAAGGIPAYTWSIVSGDGSLSPLTGSTTIYTSASTNTTTVIKVTDSHGNITTATAVKN